MLLSDIAHAAHVETRRDGLFETLGFLSDPQARMLVFVDNPRHAAALCHIPQAACVITTPELATHVAYPAGLATSLEPRQAFHRLHNYLALHTSFYGTDFDSEIDPTAHIHPRAFVSERNIRIGPGVRISANATVVGRCTVGSGVTIHPGVVLGSVGFQSTRTAGALDDMVHAGEILVEDGALILANAVIAAAVFRQATRIGREARVGNCAFVSHNVQIGARVHVGHGCVVNGNVYVGDDAWIGPGATVTNNISIGNQAHIALGSVVIRSVADGERVAGNFAVARHCRKSPRHSKKPERTGWRRP